MFGSAASICARWLHIFFLDRYARLKLRVLSPWGAMKNRRIDLSKARGFVARNVTDKEVDQLVVRWAECREAASKIWRLNLIAPEQLREQVLSAKGDSRNPAIDAAVNLVEAIERLLRAHHSTSSATPSWRVDKVERTHLDDARKRSRSEAGRPKSVSNAIRALLEARRKTGIPLSRTYSALLLETMRDNFVHASLVKAQMRPHFPSLVRTWGSFRVRAPAKPGSQAKEWFNRFDPLPEAAALLGTREPDGDK
jgi:hypothetical protein